MADPNSPKSHVMTEGDILTRAHALLVRRMETIAPLSSADREGLRSLHGAFRLLRPYDDIVSEGDQPDSICILLQGFACRYKILESGKRQILSFHIPGDVPDSQSLFLKTMDHSLCALVETSVVHFAHKAVSTCSNAFPPSRACSGVIR